MLEGTLYNAILEELYSFGDGVYSTDKYKFVLEETAMWILSMFNMTDDERIDLTKELIEKHKPIEIQNLVPLPPIQVPKDVYDKILKDHQDWLDMQKGRI